MLGGRLADLPFADTGALARGTVRLEAGLGLFGPVLQVIRVPDFDACHKRAKRVKGAVVAMQWALGMHGFEDARAARNAARI